MERGEGGKEEGRERGRERRMGGGVREEKCCSGGKEWARERAGGGER